MRTITRADLDSLNDREFEDLEARMLRLSAARRLENLRGRAAIFHDDQHVGEKRRPLHVTKDSAQTQDKADQLRHSIVVDSLEGNSLIHPLATPVIEVNQACDAARATWQSLGVEGLSKHREEPMAIVSVGFIPGVHSVQDGEWRILSGEWVRLIKADYAKGWVRDMQPTNTRPPLTAEQDRAFLGRYAYQKDEQRQPVPQPPRRDTWTRHPDPADTQWLEDSGPHG